MQGTYFEGELVTEGELFRYCFVTRVTAYACNKVVSKNIDTVPSFFVRFYISFPATGVQRDFLSLSQSFSARAGA